MPKLEVRVSQEALARWRTAAGEGGLSAWVRDACDRAAGVEGPPGRMAKVPVRDVERPAVSRPSTRVQRSERDREVEAWHRAQVAEAERSGPAVGPEPPVAPAGVEGEPAEELWRPGRCRDHPAAWPRRFDLTRCAWGCRLRDG